MKVLAAYFIIALLLSALAVAVLFGTVQASTDVRDIPIPSVPEFTVEFASGTIEVRIKNQPFTPMLVQEGNSTWTAYLHYNVRFKVHYTEDWINAYKPSTDYPKQSDSTYTVLTYAPRDENIYVLGGITTIFPPGTQIYFQVQALIGDVHRVVVSNLTNPPGPWDLSPWFFTGEESRWSETQTLTIEERQTPTSTPYQVPIIGVAIAAAVIGAGLGLLIYLIKRK